MRVSAPRLTSTAALLLGGVLALGCLAPPTKGTYDGQAGGSAGAFGGRAGAAGLEGGTGGTDGGGTSAGGGSGAAGSGGTTQTSVDEDGDGLDDAWENRAAAEYLPYLSIHSKDECSRSGIVYRVAPHPSYPRFVMLWLDVLYENDCGTGGHVGDDEVFGVLINPAQPAPQGILAIRAISHQGTMCQAITTCGKLPGCRPCAQAPRGGVPFPVVFASVNKHGTYVDEKRCDDNVVCDWGGCELATAPATLPMVNAGEPGHAFTNDLTDQGFIREENGWTAEALMHFDPWSEKEFGGAGVVSDDLVDPAFVIAPDDCSK